MLSRPNFRLWGRCSAISLLSVPFIVSFRTAALSQTKSSSFRILEHLEALLWNKESWTVDEVKTVNAQRMRWSFRVGCRTQGHDKMDTVIVGLHTWHMQSECSLANTEWCDYTYQLILLSFTYQHFSKNITTYWVESGILDLKQWFMLTVGGPVITYFELFIITNFLPAMPALHVWSSAISFSVCSERLFFHTVIPRVRDNHRLQLVEFLFSQIVACLRICTLRCLKFS